MDAKTHWEKVYATKEPETVSWYRPHLETSLALIERAARSRSDSIIDIGAGESTEAEWKALCSIAEPKSQTAQARRDSGNGTRGH